ncbi:hypothetical protein [Streptomyces sp. NPDC051214]|uniref:hypothetical protein n=1 Tax=Streptomyces sp. NPDC051214 TaxID=3155282 RepID=UPI00341A7F58
MSTAPAPEPRDPKDPETSEAPKESETPKGSAAPKKPKSALVFDDPLSQQSSDDTDRGWGERPSAGGDSAADLARFLDEKPPHHF